MAKKSPANKKKELENKKRERKNLYNKRSRLKKKLAEAPKKEAAEIKKQLKSVGATIQAKNKSIQKLRTPAKSITVLTKPKRAAVPIEGAKPLPKKEDRKLRKARKNLYNKRYYWTKKREEATTQKERQKINRKLLEISNKITDVNEDLGLELPYEPIPSDRITVKDDIQEELVPVWEARERLTDLLKGGFFNVYFLEGNRFTKSQVAQIYDAFSDMEDLAYSKGRRTPFVVFELNLGKKEVTIYVE